MKKEKTSKLFPSKRVKGMLTDGQGAYYPDDKEKPNHSPKDTPEDAKAVPLDGVASGTQDKPLSEWGKFKICEECYPEIEKIVKQFKLWQDAKVEKLKEQFDEWEIDEEERDRIINKIFGEFKWKK